MIIKSEQDLAVRRHQKSYGVSPLGLISPLTYLRLPRRLPVDDDFDVGVRLQQSGRRVESGALDRQGQLVEML